MQPITYATRTALFLLLGSELGGLRFQLCIYQLLSNLQSHARSHTRTKSTEIRSCVSKAPEPKYKPLTKFDRPLPLLRPKRLICQSSSTNPTLRFLFTMLRHETPLCITQLQYLPQTTHTDIVAFWLVIRWTTALSSRFGPSGSQRAGTLTTCPL